MRKTHLVGAWPGRSAPDAMATALDRIGPHLVRMTDGETGERSLWLTPSVEWLRANPDVELKDDGKVEDGMPTDYESGSTFRVREGHQLDPANLHLGYHHWFTESFPAFKYLRDQAGYPDVRFQVGVPAPLDIAVAGFGDAFDKDTALAEGSMAEPWAEATAEQIRLILDDADEPVVFQLETVACLVAVAEVPDEDKVAVAEQMAAGLKDVVRRSPEGTVFGAHLCLGDFRHKALAEMSDARPLVLLANALATDFPAGRTLEYIHAPFAAADKPGSFEESWYRPLEELDIPDDVRFVAGFIHEDIATEDHVTLVEMIERFAGREVDVAAACGLGRRPDPEEAWDSMNKAIALIEDSAAKG